MKDLEELQYFLSGEYDIDVEKYGAGGADPGHEFLKAALDIAEYAVIKIKRRIEDIEASGHLQCSNSRCSNSRQYFGDDYCSWCAEERGIHL